MAEEKSTEDLLKRLLASSTVDEYLSEGKTLDRTLATYLEEPRERLGVKKAAVVRDSGLNPTVVYDIFAGKSRPGRDHVIMLAFGLHCSLIETQRLLRLAGVAELWPKVRRDSIIIWCIENGKTRAECEDELWSRGEKTLLGTGPLKHAAV